ncbi:VOC family protein [Massilia horti]|uniref:VOC family protein n=1 Tax=Massilia horti TaxID=2562153 RepID=A0A4Y9T3A0_9BURK|nr:VOC family protein [Massilia horti]TFW31526.1 VOC family protein [Massilia horti]
MSTANVKPIPEGMHSITPHLVCTNAAGAIEFYKKAFGAEEMARLPMPDGRIAHALLQIGDSKLMLTDEMPECQSLSPSSLKGSPVTLHLYVPNADAAFERAVAAGAKVRMPPADMFWGDRYGVVEDPNGHVWSIAHHQRDVAPQDMAAAMQRECA